jgi:amidase
MILMGVLAKGTPTWNEVREQVANDFVGFMRTALFNATGSPTVTAPCGLTLDGRPGRFPVGGQTLRRSDPTHGGACLSAGD